jgi:hypothetical protein
MPGSTDGAELTGARESAPDHVAFCRLDGMGAPVEKCFVAQWLAYAYPVNASRTASRPPAHDSGPMWFATPSS